MNKVAIITARGGSKRIPRKNIKKFCGKPIIAYSIENALQTNLFDEVMVSTDDEEIAEIAKSYGAEVPFIRSEKNSDDFAGTADVLLEVISAYKAKGKSFDVGCCLYPTAVFANSEILIKAFKMFEENSFDSLFPVVEYSTPIQRALEFKAEGKITMVNTAFEKTRSQDLSKAYFDPGQFYWFDIPKLQANKKLWTEHSGAIVISEMEAQDIDNLIDWKMAELKYSLKN